jgi:hypothetical protein
MRHQFFADDRDVFKYDLVEKIAKAMTLDFTFIPMLTPDEAQPVDKVGQKNKELWKFLEPYRIGKPKNVFDIRKHFDSVKIKTRIYREGENAYFEQKRRKEYFENIPNEWLAGSLILIDPDNGLKPEKPKKEHVQYKEVEGIYSRMEKSILMIFQYRPQRQKWDECIQEKLNGLKKEIKESLPILHIRDGTIAFFFLAKNPNLHNVLKRALEAYKECYRLKGITS